MYSFVVICDDLTGSSCQAILLKQRGLSVHQMARFAPELIPESSADVLVINADSRRKPASEVRRLFDEILSLWPKDMRICKRIDTTLRGHVYLETCKILEKDDERVALVVSAFPDSRRTTIGGYQLLKGNLLERTEVASDPIWPISTSYVPDYFKGVYPVDSLRPCDLYLEPDVLVNRMAGLARDNRVITADAQTDGDIELLAIAAARSGVNFVPVDPSPFTAAYVYHSIHRERQKPVMAVIGSTSEKTRKQILYLKNKLRVCSVEAGNYEEGICEVFDEGRHDVLLITPPREFIPGREDEMASSMARTALLWLDDEASSFSGIILSGGDTAVQFFESFSVRLVSSEEEIVPLMIGTVVEDGLLKGLRAVTKGGLVGDDDALYRAVNWLRKKRRQVK